MTTREQFIEGVAEQYEPSPAPHYSDRELSRQLVVSQTALGRVEIERNAWQDKAANLEAENAKLRAALRTIAYEPIGPSDASDRDILRGIENIAREMVPA